MEKLYKADKLTAEEIVNDFNMEEKKEKLSKLTTVGTFNINTSKEEVDELITKAIKQARELASQKKNV